MRKLSVLALLLALLASSCAGSGGSHTAEGAAIGTGTGAALGAALGYAIGGSGHSAAMGAAAVAGGLTGVAIGAQMDQQEAELRHSLASSEYASVRREREIIYVTFRSDVLFDSGSARLKQGAYRELDQVAKVLHDYPETRIVIDGHTDAVGSLAYNRDLSERRAESVRDDLIEQGVSPRRIETYGHGPSRPIASNNTESGRQLNRRVEITIIPMSN
jgi:outer membrane protein OmpA-like peptidoglycan-associated protein